MAKKERNQGSVGRARAKRGSAGDMSAEEFDAFLARRRTASSFDAETQNEDFFRGMSAEDTMKMLRGPTRPTPRPGLAPAASQKPTPRPSTAEERAAAERGDRAARRDAGMKAGGKVKKMMNGGKCRGMGAATKGGNYSRG